MSKFELGQFLISLGCEVDLTKFGRQLLQCREWGMQQSEPATGRRGTMVQIQQISTWRSSFGSKMGDPMPLQQQTGGLDPMREESPSQSAMDGQRTQHEGRDLIKKKSPSTAKKDKDGGRNKEGSRSQGASWQPSDKESDKE